MIFINKVKDIFLNRTFILFIIIGCINTFNGIIISYVYSIILGKLISFILGYLTGLMISYMLNSYFTFKEPMAFHKLIKFCISCIPNFMIQFLVVLVGMNLFHLHKLVAYGMAAVIGVPITFLILRLFVFTKKHINLKV